MGFTLDDKPDAVLRRNDIVGHDLSGCSFRGHGIPVAPALVSQSKDIWLTFFGDNLSDRVQCLVCAAIPGLAEINPISRFIW